MTTPAELFTRAARALFGDHFAAPLGHALKVDKGTVSKWADGKSRIPAGVWGELEALAIARTDELEKVLEAIVAASDARKI